MQNSYVYKVFRERPVAAMSSSIEDAPTCFAASQTMKAQARASSRA